MFNKETIEPYFSHDIGTRQSSEIKKLLFELGWEGYGLWWAIVEFMHRNNFRVEDEQLIAYDLRCGEEIIHRIMNDYGLFSVQDGYYISNRILRNQNYHKVISEKRQSAATTRWLLSAFNKAYCEFFGEEPILQSSEIEALKRYNEKIPDLKTKLRDIVYTLKSLKFDTDINFKPTANWLLKGNNLARLVNGEFGQLKHKKTAKELQKEQKQLELEKQKENESSEFDLKLERISGKAEALDFIEEYYAQKELVINGKRLIIIPPLQRLMKRFDITNKEVLDRCRNS